MRTTTWGVYKSISDIELLKYIMMLSSSQSELKSFSRKLKKYKAESLKIKAIAKQRF